MNMGKRFCVLVSCFVLFTLLVGCSVGNNKDEAVADKKEQYAIIQNYEDGTEITVTPDHSNYDEVVEKFTYAAMEEGQTKVPDEAEQLKRIVFYQAPTETLDSSDETHDMKPLIEVDIYVNGDDQYAVGYLSNFKSIKFSFQMSEDLIELVEMLEN